MDGDNITAEKVTEYYEFIMANAIHETMGIKATWTAAATVGPQKKAKQACRFYARGLCNKGDRCEFSHLNKKKQAPRPVCRDWKEGKCRRGKDCRFSHNESSDSHGNAARQTQADALFITKAVEEATLSLALTTKVRDSKETEQQEFLLDSTSNKYIVNKLKTNERNPETMLVRTSNGIAKAILTRAKTPLGDNEALYLPKSPNLQPLCKLIEAGWTFEWRGVKDSRKTCPMLTSPDGTKYVLETSQGVPIMPKACVAMKGDELNNKRREWRANLSAKRKEIFNSIVQEMKRRVGKKEAQEQTAHEAVGHIPYSQQ